MTTEPHTDEAPATQTLVSATMGDRCVTCGTPMSSDQRYCVVCGERRGKPRFSVPVGDTSASPSSELARTGVPAPVPAPRSTRASSGTTIVAGVGTLLLAMGVGVLIGRNSASNANTRPVQAAAPTIIHVGGAGDSATTAAATPSKSAGKSSKSTQSRGKAKAKSKAATKPTAAQAAKAANAASKVLGSSNKNLPPATVTVGQTGHGPGYDKSGKFTGSFFGQ